MLNLEKFKKEIFEVGSISFKVGKNDNITSCVVDCCEGCLFYHDDCCKADILRLEWLYKEYKEPILSEEGKTLIIDLVKGFGMENVNYITKIANVNGYDYSLYIDLKNGFISLHFLFQSENYKLFKGMELKKQYKVEELGLC